MSTPTAADPTARAREAVAANPHWYHTIELAPGVVTPGQVDLREDAGVVLPKRMDGWRALDIGTFDGFWAFEMERRGAQVIALDLDDPVNAEWPPNNRAYLEKQARDMDVTLGRGFKLAREAIGSGVDRRICSIYDLTPEKVDGHVDFAFLGALQLHLRDPIKGLEAIYHTLKPGGYLLMFEPFSMTETILRPKMPAAELQPIKTPFNWWFPNLAGLQALPVIAGFEDVRRRRVRYIKGVKAMRQWCAAVSARKPRDA